MKTARKSAFRVRSPGIFPILVRDDAVASFPLCSETEEISVYLCGSRSNCKDGLTNCRPL